MAEEIGPVVWGAPGKLPSALYQHRCGHVDCWPYPEGPDGGGCDACESGSPYVTDWRLLYAPLWPDEPLAAAGGGEHVYLSTSCLHARAATDSREAKRLHGYCQSMVGAQGEKRPGQCKFCDAHCVCECHRLSAAEPAEVPKP